jgi:hypothetical protein
VVPAVLLFAEARVLNAVLITFMNALPWGEDMELVGGKQRVADEGG